MSDKERLEEIKLKMTAVEYLWGYCQLILHGYSHDEAKEKLEEIKVKMQRRKSE